ncbi:hypothetical protein FRC19_000122 [Serendipita sp. 401]|nr:hypothetical protein FRC19_000122 [Serendipita sp. 401]KAG9058815.1 hypothetical protein FS842_000012 [Serendipita sp. 407]
MWDYSHEELERQRRARIKNAESHRQYRVGKKEQEHKVVEQVHSLRTRLREMEAELASKNAELVWYKRKEWMNPPMSNSGSTLLAGMVTDYRHDPLPALFSGLNPNRIHKRHELEQPFLNYGRSTRQIVDTTIKALSSIGVISHDGSSTSPTDSRLNGDVNKRHQSQKPSS